MNTILITSIGGILLLIVLSLIVFKDGKGRNKHNIKLNNRLNNLTLDKQLIITKYERLGIAIPYDILEDIQFMTFNNDKEMIEYIENQRVKWKYECMKKFIRLD